MARQKTPRMRKVNELMREIVAEAVQDLKDPRIGFLTITGVETNPDLRSAVVYYSVMGTDEDKSATGDALRSAAPRIQREVASQSTLRYTPKLEFRVDPSIEEGIRISKLISELDTGEDPDPDD